MPRIRWNAMKPRSQRVLAPWKSGFMASGAGPSFMINLSYAERPMPYTGAYFMLHKS
jgi:hypothetical protein